MCQCTHQSGSPEEDSDGELETLTGDFFTTDANSQNYLQILGNIETLFDNSSCHGKKTGGCFTILQGRKQRALR